MCTLVKMVENTESSCGTCRVDKCFNKLYYLLFGWNQVSQKGYVHCALCNNHSSKSTKTYFLIPILLQPLIFQTINYVKGQIVKIKKIKDLRNNVAKI